MEKVTEVVVVVEVGEVVVDRRQRWGEVMDLYINIRKFIFTNEYYFSPIPSVR